MTLNIETVATILLAGRLVSVFFIVKVLLLQYRLFGTEIDFELVPNLTKLQRSHIYLMRKILFGLSMIILAGNIIPVIIDIVTIVADTNRPAQIHSISILYALSNSTTAMLSSLMVWVLYQVAGLGSKTK